MTNDLRAFAMDALRHCENTSPHIRQRKTTVLLETLARGIIAERPADEPVTEAWIRSNERAFDKLAELELTNSVHKQTDGSWLISVFGGRIHYTTLSPFRRLCEALGVPLVETKP